MSLEWAGMILGATAVATIGIGHVLVRKLNYHFGTKPAPLAFLIRLLAFITSLFVEQNTLSGLLGIVGITTCWDGYELIRQEERVRKGIAPANPNRPVEKRGASTS